jgi:hypothetical protein
MGRVQRRNCSFNWVFCLFAATAAAGAVACAPDRPASTVLTSADVTAKDVPTAKEEAAPAEEPPAGELVCRIDGPEGKAELYLDWKKSSATGTLRIVAPSGNTTEHKVEAERYKGMIIADDIHSRDLVVHAATVRDHEGKRYMRIGEWSQSWMKCQ